MSGGSAAERPYLSIGEVLGMLLEEFPDVTISKIRFLESQGLIVPERTASGYRKFYDDDVELLRYILREQKEHFLPLRVIKDRLETPPEGLDRPPPRVLKTTRHQSATDRTDVFTRTDMTRPVVRDDRGTSSLDRTVTRGHPAGQRVLRAVEDPTTSSAKRAVDPTEVLDRGATYSRRELASLAECDEALVRELERFGMLTARLIGDERVFEEQDLAICEIAARFVAAGIDIRHLRAWKTAVDREAGLFEQRVLPILRRRSPESRLESEEILDELSDLGARLRAILLAKALSSLREGR